MAILKGNMVKGAYSRLRISGLTVNPGAADNVIALTRLESMAARWFKKNICAGYNFEDTPDPSTPSGVDAGDRDAFEANLAIQLIPDFNKQAHPTLYAIAAATYNDLAKSSTVVKPLQYSNRVPRGRGSRRSTQSFGSNYYHTSAEAPHECATNEMVVGDINDFVEHFDAYLDLGEDVASYTLEETAGLTILTQSLATPDVLYRVEAVGGDDGTVVVQNVKIVATTTNGRVTTRVIYFNLTEVS